jgi:hypothetical protein
MMKWAFDLIPFLEPYPGWYKGFVFAWLFVVFLGLLSLLLIGVVIHPKQSTKAGQPAAKQQVTASGGATVNQAGRDVINSGGNTTQVSSGQYSPNIAAKTVNLTVNLTYVSPRSEQAKMLVGDITERLRIAKVNLLNSYPLGFTLLGISGPIFTAINHEGGTLQLDGQNTSIRTTLDRSVMELRAQVLPGNLAPSYSFDGRKVKLVNFAFVTTFPLTVTDPTRAPCNIEGVDIFVEIVDNNPNGPIVAIGFKSGQPDRADITVQDMLSRVQNDIDAKAKQNPQ